jgi:hypothetical protein
MSRLAHILVFALAASSAAQDAPLVGPIVRLPLPPDELAPATAAQTPEALPPAVSAMPAEEEEARVILEEPGWHVWEPTFWDPWEGNVELGLSGTEGNSETFNVRAGLNAKHKTELLVRTLQIVSIQKSADGVTTANTALVDGRIEWPMPESRWNYYLHGLIEYDQFKAFDYRLSADTGFGFEFVDNEATTLVGRAGLSASQEIGGPNGDVRPELALGSEYKHKFNATHSIHAKVDYYPDVTEFGEFRLNSQAGWEIALSSAWGLSLKLSVIDRYDSTPEGARPNDLDYSTLLLWQF